MGASLVGHKFGPELRLGLADDAITEADSHLALGSFSRDRFEARFFGRRRPDAPLETLETRHQEEQAHDRRRPQHEHQQKEELISRHRLKCLKT